MLGGKPNPKVPFQVTAMMGVTSSDEQEQSAARSLPLIRVMTKVRRLWCSTLAVTEK
jgi:hypothetical protein